MEEELQELREMEAQLWADNEKLRQERILVASPGSSILPGDAGVLPVMPPVISVGANAGLSEWSVFVPRDRKCPNLNGRSGIGINEWIEEAQASQWIHHLSIPDLKIATSSEMGELREMFKVQQNRLNQLTQITDNNPLSVIWHQLSLGQWNSVWLLTLRCITDLGRAIGMQMPFPDSLH